MIVRGYFTILIRKGVNDKMSTLIANTGLFTIRANFTNNLVKILEYASRTCYDSHDKTESDSWKTHISSRIKSRHESVIEHGRFAVIVDYSVFNDIFTAEDVYKEVDIINKLLCDSNSLIRYAKEDGYLIKYPKVPIISLSGNMKMWRDLIKFIFSNKSEYLSSTTKFIIQIFALYDKKYSNVFSLDIPELNKYKPASLDGELFMLPKDSVIENITTRDKLYDIEKDKLFKIYDDNGITSRLINTDHFGRGLLIEPDIPSHILEYLRDHVLDINSVTYTIDLPRAISLQEARHRVNSISQRSQRYVSESPEDSKYYIPDSIDKDKKYKLDNGVEISYDEYFKLSLSLYNELVKDKVKKEDSRFVLPSGIITTMVITKPLYTLPHYFFERCAKGAQKEIREPAIALRDVLETTYDYLTGNNYKLF